MTRLNEPEERRDLEEPVLAGDHVAIALHFAGPTTAGASQSSDVGSYERDLLAYAYRDEPSRPCYSHRSCQGEPFVQGRQPMPGSALISFPNEISFETEGQQVTLVHDEQLKASARVSVGVGVAVTATRFERSATEIHSVSLFAPAGPVWNEYALIKLAKLSEKGEQVDLGDLVLFDGEPWTTWTTRYLQQGMSLRGVTVQVVLGEGASMPRIDAGAITEAFAAQSSLLRSTQLAMQGITQAIFDFKAVDADEVIDALSAPVVANDRLAVWLKKGVVLSVGRIDRTLDAGRRQQLGVSPYLIIPHAVLLHNEEILNRAARAIDAARRGTTDTRADAARRKRIRRMLWREVLGNIFHYPTERQLFDLGVAQRGLAEKQAELERGLAEVNAAHVERSERAQARGQLVVEGMLGAVALLSVLEPVSNTVGGPVAWMVFLIGTIAFLGVLSRRISRTYGTDAADEGDA